MMAFFIALTDCLPIAAEVWQKTAFTASHHQAMALLGLLWL
jgi:hypothetical protein